MNKAERVKLERILQLLLEVDDERNHGPSSEDVNGLER